MARGADERKRHVDEIGPDSEVLLDGEIQREHVPTARRPALLSNQGSGASQHPRQSPVPLLVHLDAAKTGWRIFHPVIVNAVVLVVPVLARAE
jgi:hypothetical protein